MGVPHSPEAVADELRRKLREANQSLAHWRAEAKAQERSRLLAEEQFAEASHKLVVMGQELGRALSQLAELSSLPGKLAGAVAENKKLAKLLNRRNGKENPFGLATPSAKQVNKPNSSPENRGKRGGAKAGHKGNGRKNFTAEEADRAVKLDAPPPPCGCGGHWDVHSKHPHCVINYVPAKMEKVHYEKTVHQCSGCGALSETAAPGVTPGHKYSDKAVANMLAEHYYHGHTAGSLERRWDVNLGTLFNFAHWTAGLLAPLFERIILHLRLCLVIHADETPWSDDGARGYAWFFGNDQFKVYVFRHTRGSVVPLDVLGKEPLPGTLVTDRYGGYVVAIKIGRQYCLVHILRDVKKEGLDFPGEEEVQRFVAALKPLLSEAISLRRTAGTAAAFQSRAAELKAQIMALCEAQAKHPAVQYLQDIFREEPDRLFRWAESPDIPADNNFSERHVRPLAIARKISFGSQSDQGLKTREVLMTILHTAQCRGWDPAEFLEHVLGTLVMDPKADISKMLDLDAPVGLAAVA